MDDEKWKWTEPSPDEPTAEEKERQGMLFLLVAGIIIFAGGFFFAWKIGAFNFNEFFGVRPEDSFAHRHNLRDIVWFFHAPWLAGKWMIVRSITYLLRHRR